MERAGHPRGAPPSCCLQTPALSAPTLRAPAGSVSPCTARRRRVVQTRLPPALTSAPLHLGSALSGLPCRRASERSTDPDAPAAPNTSSTPRHDPGVLERRWLGLGSHLSLSPNGISAQRCLPPSFLLWTDNNQRSLTSWALCAVPPAPQASASPSAKWDDVIPLLILELSGGSNRTRAQEIPEGIEGRGSANPRPLLAPLPRSPLDFREGSFLKSPCHVPHSTESRGTGSGAHSPDVITVHVLLRAPVDDPVGQLPPTAAAQHHSWQGWSQRSAVAPEPSPSARSRHHPSPSPGSHPWGAVHLLIGPHPSLPACPTPRQDPPHSAWGSWRGRGGGPKRRPLCSPALLKPQPR